jgi:hypothetical protein
MSARVKARNDFESAVNWLTENVGLRDHFDSSGADRLVNTNDYGKFAGCLLHFMRTHGARLDRMDEATYAEYAVGDGWSIAYLCSENEQEHLFTDLVVSVDDDTQAVQLKLTLL